MILGIILVCVVLQGVVLLHISIKLSELSSCYGWLKESLEDHDDDDYGGDDPNEPSIKFEMREGD